MLQRSDHSFSSTIKEFLIIGLLICFGNVSGQKAIQTGFQIHQIAGLSAKEEELRAFTLDLAPKLVEIVNSEYFRYAMLNTSMEEMRHYRKGPISQEEMLNYLLKADEDRFDEYCRKTGVEMLDVFDTKDRIIDVAIEFISEAEMSARNWSPMTVGFTPLGCPYIRVAKKHFNRYLEYDFEIFAISTLLHEYMHTQYFNHVSREVNRKDVPYSVEDISNRTYRWLQFLEQQPTPLGKWQWVYSVIEGDTLYANHTNDSYAFELTPKGQFLLKVNERVKMSEITKITYLSAENNSYRFKNYLSDTEQSGIDLLFNEQGVMLDFFPQSYGTVNFFRKVK